FGGGNHRQVSTDSTTVDGDYTNCLLYPGGTGHAHYVDSTQTTTGDSSDFNGGLEGRKVTVHTIQGNAHATITTPHYSGNADFSIDLTEMDNVFGHLGVNGSIATVLTDQMRDTGSSTYSHHLLSTFGFPWAEDFSIGDQRSFTSTAWNVNGLMALQ